MSIENVQQTQTSPETVQPISEEKRKELARLLGSELQRALELLDEMEGRGRSSVAVGKHGDVVAVGGVSHETLLNHDRDTD